MVAKLTVVTYMVAYFGVYFKENGLQRTISDTYMEVTDNVLGYAEDIGVLNHLALHDKHRAGREEIIVDIEVVSEVFVDVVALEIDHFHEKGRYTEEGSLRGVGGIKRVRRGWKDIEAFFNAYGEVCYARIKGSDVYFIETRPGDTWKTIVSHVPSSHRWKRLDRDE